MSRNINQTLPGAIGVLGNMEGESYMLYKLPISPVPELFLSDAAAEAAAAAAAAAAALGLLSLWTAATRGAKNDS